MGVERPVPNLFLLFKKALLEAKASVLQHILNKFR